MDKAGLGQLQIFAEMSEEELDAIAKYMEVTKFSSGNVIFHRNDPGGTMYIVVEGEVQINAVIAHDLKKSLVHVPPGAVFGELSLFTNELRSADAVAVEDSKLLALETPAFQQMLFENPTAGAKILTYLTTIISDRLRNTTDMYRSALEWSLSVSGAINLHMDQLITNSVNLSIKLSSGDTVTGRLLKVDQNMAGHVLYLESSHERLEIVPYHAIVAMSFDKDGVDLEPKADLL